MRYIWFWVPRKGQSSDQMQDWISQWWSACSSRSLHFSFVRNDFKMRQCSVAIGSSRFSFLCPRGLHRKMPRRDLPRSMVTGPSTFGCRWYASRDELENRLRTVYILHTFMLFLGVADNGFCPRKWVYMMGFVHCVQRVKRGIRDGFSLVR